MAESVEVKTTRLDDGRLFIADEWLQDNPWAMSFINRFPDYWRRDDYLSGYVSPFEKDQK